MVTINGVKAELAHQPKRETHERKMSMNEVLDRLQTNFDSVNAPNQSSFDGSTKKGTPNSSTDSSSNTQNSFGGGSLFSNLFGGGNGNEMLMKFLPMMLSKNGTSKKTQQQKLLKEILKNSGNPLVEKLFQMMPTKSNFRNTLDPEEPDAHAQPKIDSFQRIKNF